MATVELAQKELDATSTRVYVARVPQRRVQKALDVKSTCGSPESGFGECSLWRINAVGLTRTCWDMIISASSRDGATSRSDADSLSSTLSGGT